jgi:hypothetical protein
MLFAIGRLLAINFEQAVSAPYLATRTVSGPHLAQDLKHTMRMRMILAMILKKTASAALSINPITSSHRAGTEVVPPSRPGLSAILVMLIPLPQVIQQCCGFTRNNGGKS